MNMCAMRMHQNDSYSGVGCVILGWYTLYDMHDNVWESIRRSHNAWSCLWWESTRMPRMLEKDSYSGRGGGSFEADIHYTTCMIMNGNAWEWLRMHEKESYLGRSRGWFYVELHYTTCMIMNGNAWEWLRMTLNRSYSRRGGGSFYADVHNTTSMIMFENAWEWLGMLDNDSYSVRGCQSSLIYIIRHAW